MIRLGIPYAVTLIGYFLLQCASRGVLQLYFNMDEVGLYYMGANFARLIELPLVAFINAWFPFYGSFVNKQAEILPTARKILTYYVMGTSLMIAFFFAGARPIVQLMLHSNFSGVWMVIGILAFAQSLWGVYNIFYIGLYFHKKFTWQLYIELSAGALCILFNLILIPVLHREGAAVATLLSFVAICGITYRVNQHLFPIYFEWGKIFRILIGLSAVALISFLPLPLYFYIAMMGLVVIGYLIYLWLFCLDVLERVSLKRIFLRKPLIASKIVKNIETL
jgi:O-antigen/teichoic acid export membrane protein